MYENSNFCTPYKINLANDNIQHIKLRPKIMSLEYASKHSKGPCTQIDQTTANQIIILFGT
jgi:hypothetical protein